MSRSKPRADPRIDFLVGIVREFAQAAGYDAAETLMFHFGGQRLYVPQKMRPTSPFWPVLGPEAAKTLSRVANKGGAQGSGVEVEIPRGSRLMLARRNAQLAGFEGSKNQAALKFGVHRRTVQRYRQKAPVKLPLFDRLPKAT